MKIFKLPSGAPDNGVGFGITDILYIQEGINEAVASIVSAQLPDGYNAPVIMNGCVVTKVGTNYTHTAGQIFYQGFLYTVDALTTSLSSPSGEAKWAAFEIPEPIDNSVVFDDGHDYNIDIHLKFRLVASTESGIVDWDEIRRLEHILFNKTKELYEIITIPKLPSVDFFTDYFDANGVGLVYNKYEGFEIATGFDKSVDFAGKTLVGINFRDTSLADVRLKSTDVGATATNTYFPIGVGVSWLTLIGSFIGKWKHVLSHGELPPQIIYGNRDGGESGGFAGGGLFGPYTTNSLGAGAAHNNLQPSVVSIIIQKVSEISA